MQFKELALSVISRNQNITQSQVTQQRFDLGKHMIYNSMLIMSNSLRNGLNFIFKNMLYYTKYMYFHEYVPEFHITIFYVSKKNSLGPTGYTF